MMTSCTVVDGQPVARELVAPEIEVEEVAAGDALGEDAAGAGNGLQRRPRSRRRSARSSSRSAPKILMPTGVRIPVVSMSMRFLIGIVQALVWPGKLQRRRSARSTSSSQVMRSRQSGRRTRLEPVRRPATSTSAAVVAPLAPRGLSSDRRLHHRERRRIGRGLGAAGLAEDALDLGEGACRIRSCTCSSACASVTEMPGRSSACRGACPRSSGGMNSEPSRRYDRDRADDDRDRRRDDAPSAWRKHELHDRLVQRGSRTRLIGCCSSVVSCRPARRW